MKWEHEFEVPFPNWLEIKPFETIIGRGVHLRSEPFDPELIREKAMLCFKAFTTLEEFATEKSKNRISKQFASEIAASFGNIGKPEVLRLRDWSAKR